MLRVRCLLGEVQGCGVVTGGVPGCGRVVQIRAAQVSAVRVVAQGALAVGGPGLFGAAQLSVPAHLGVLTHRRTS